MPNIPAMLTVAHDIKTQLDALIYRWYVQDSGEHRVAATLCLTIAEQFAATLHLIDGGYSSHAPIMVRSMLEGLANLLILVKDPSFVDQIRYDNARADVVMFKEYASDPSMQDDAEALATLNKWKAQAEPIRDALAKKGYGPLHIGQKFRKANIQSTYVSYRVFCSFSHNQLTTLLARHADNIELRYHDEASAELTGSILTIAVSILCQAINSASHFTNLTKDELRQTMDAIDNQWTAVRAIEG